MRYIRILSISLLAILNTCNTVTEPVISEESLITDFIKTSYDTDYIYLNNQFVKVLDLDFAIQYHFEGSGGQIEKYLFYLKDLKTQAGEGTGWHPRADSAMRVRATPKFFRENSSDTLLFSHLYNVTEEDSLYKEFKFTLKGFYCDTPYVYLADTVSLKSFEYTYKDTIRIVM